MAKNKDKKFIHAAHIKRHTEGTSNEISFSVLDAAKNKVDSEEGRDEKALTPFGRITLWSWRPKKVRPGTPTRDDALALSSSAAASASSAEAGAKNQVGRGTPGIPTSIPNTSSSGPAMISTGISPETEIKMRKGRRRKRRRILYSLSALIIISGLVGGGYYLYTEIQKHQSNVSLLDQSLNKIDESDKTIILMDKAINDFAGTENKDIEAMLAEMPNATQYLDEAKGMAEQAKTAMRESTEKEAAEHAVEAIDARKEMIVNGEALLRAELAARTEKDTIQQAWTSVLKGDEIAREAADLVTNTTTENVELSKQKTYEAITKFEEGLNLLYELSSSSSFELEIQPAIDYVSKRLESMNHAIASDEAILAQKRETAQSENDAYNTTEAEASLLAKELPDDIVSIVEKAHETYVSGYTEQYMAVRQEASIADAFLRDYLGT